MVKQQVSVEQQVSAGVDRQDLHRHRPPQPPRHAPEHTAAVARPRTADGNGGVTMGLPYDAPGYGAAAGDAERVSRVGLAWRIVASIVLAAVGVNALVVVVRILAGPADVWAGAIGMALVAAIALAYPVVNLVRWVRAARP